MMKVSTYQAPWGELLLAAEDEALVGLWIRGQKHFPKLKEAEYGESRVLQETAKWLDAYFAGKKPAIDKLPLSVSGTSFQKTVWQELCRIPYGETVTYGAIARKIAQSRGLCRMSAQAVGGAVGKNPVGIIIPCHRVIGANGSLTGYAGGIEVKKWLLNHEGVI